MTRLRSALWLALAVAWTAAGSASVAASERAAVAALPFDAATFSNDLNRIASLDRTTGTAGENEAIDYIAVELSKASVEWKVEPFQAYVSFPLRASLAVDGVAAGDALTYSFGGNTPVEGVSGRLVVASVRTRPTGIRLVGSHCPLTATGSS